MNTTCQAVHCHDDLLSTTCLNETRKFVLSRQMAKAYKMFKRMATDLRLADMMSGGGAVGNVGHGMFDFEAA